MKRAAFKQPRQAVTVADEWVKGDHAAEAPAQQLPLPKIAMTRLTIDLPADLHHRFKVACAEHRTRMVEEVRRFIEEWTQKHGNL
jgi:ParG